MATGAPAKAAPETWLRPDIVHLGVNIVQSVFECGRGMTLFPEARTGQYVVAAAVERQRILMVIEPFDPPAAHTHLDPLRLPEADHMALAWWQGLLCIGEHV